MKILKSKILKVKSCIRALFPFPLDAKTTKPALLFTTKTLNSIRNYLEKLILKIIKETPHFHKKSKSNENFSIEFFIKNNFPHFIEFVFCI